jgi:hypothetical protein
VLVSLQVFYQLPAQSRSVTVTLSDSRPTQPMRERELTCPHCGYYLTSTTAPWGRIKAYCRGACRKFVYVYLGKPPDAMDTKGHSS